MTTDLSAASRTRLAVAHLRAARDQLRKAKATRAAARVRSALKSAEGAVRHSERRAPA